MAQTYSTGELAKLVKVSVRTVQYYDKRGILPPSDLTEGGRRLYSEQDLDKLRTICFLRDLDFSISQIQQLLQSDEASEVLQLLLRERIAELKQDIDHRKEQLDTAVNLLNKVKKSDNPSLEQVSAISITMKNQKTVAPIIKKSYLLLTMTVAVYLLTPLLFNLTGSAIPWFKGFYIILTIAYLATLVWLGLRFRSLTAYMCPNCHTVFEPSKRDYWFAVKTPKARKLTCPHCHQKSFCIIVAKKDKVN